MLFLIFRLGFLFPASSKCLIYYLFIIFTYVPWIFSREPRLYKRVCPSIGLLVCWSICRLVTILSRRVETSWQTTYFVYTNLFFLCLVFLTQKLVLSKQIFEIWPQGWDTGYLGHPWGWKKNVNFFFWFFFFFIFFGEID